jgi:hypothetical protein
MRVDCRHARRRFTAARRKNLGAAVMGSDGGEEFTGTIVDFSVSTAHRVCGARLPTCSADGYAETSRK